jgi:hypothetical protein
VRRSSRLIGRNEWRLARARTHIPAHASVLSSTEADALTQELVAIVDHARYPLSSRIQTLRVVLARLRPEPARPAASPQPRGLRAAEPGTVSAEGVTGSPVKDGSKKLHLPIASRRAKNET